MGKNVRKANERFVFQSEISACRPPSAVRVSSRFLAVASVGPSSVQLAEEFDLPSTLQSPCPRHLVTKFAPVSASEVLFFHGESLGLSAGDDCSFRIER